MDHKSPANYHKRRQNYQKPAGRRITKHHRALAYVMVYSLFQVYKQIHLKSVQSFHVILTGELITSFSPSPCFLKISRRFW